MCGMNRNPGAGNPGVRQEDRDKDEGADNSNGSRVREGPSRVNAAI